LAELNEKAKKIFALKYSTRKTKQWLGACKEIADFIAEGERPYNKNNEEIKNISDKYYNMLSDLFSLPGGRIIANAGTGIKNLANCFVIGIKDSRQSIYQALKDAAEIFAMGGGVGYSFSDIREEGADINSTGGKASGPLSFMTLFDQTGEVIQQASRRGAQLGSLFVSHPDIERFIGFKSTLNSRNERLVEEYDRNLKSVSGTLKSTKYEKILEKTLLDDQLTHFNISVLLTDDFMQAVVDNKNWDLISPKNNETVKTVNARDLLYLMAKQAHASGDPGELFYDRINKDNIVPYMGNITATNPCITGDTLIAVADGRNSVTIKELAEQNKDVPVYSLDKENNVVVSLMRNPRITGKNQPIYAVKLDNGQSLKVTSNHKFLLSDGSQKQAIDLSYGDSVKVLSRTIEKMGKSNTDYYHLYSGIWHDFEHQLIAKYYLNNNEYSSDKVVHHLDKNGLNNSLENITMLSAGDHNKIHNDNNVGENNSNYSGYSNDELWNHAIILTKNLGRRFSTEEWESYAKELGLPYQFSQWRKDVYESVMNLSKLVAEYLNLENVDIDPRLNRRLLNSLKEGYKCFLSKENEIIYTKKCEVCNKDFDTKNREASICSTVCQNKYIYENFKEKQHSNLINAFENKKELVRQKQIKILLDLKLKLNRIPDKKEWMNECKTNNISFEISRKSSPFRSYTELCEKASLYNHKIISVKFIGCEDVYNGTVDDNHNYAIGGFKEKTVKKNNDKEVFVFTANCGEVPLLEGESCILASINLHQVYDKKNKCVDWELLKDLAKTQTRFLEDVTEITVAPLEYINDMTKGLRRLGGGVMGFADLLVELDIPYDSEKAVELSRKLSWFISFHSWETSFELAKERGCFKFYDKDKVNLNVVEKSLYNNPYQKSEISIDDLYNIGVRNVAVNSLAPTGSIALLGGVNSGIEPFFSLAYKRNITEGVGNIAKDSIFEVNPALEGKLKDSGYSKEDITEIISYSVEHGTIKNCPLVSKEIQNIFKTANEIHWKDHVNIQAAWQEYVSNAISKTINVPEKATVEDIFNIYIYMWQKGLKGGTIYRNNSKSFQILEKIDEN
jgi:ribonucleotide reductase alpha subunit